MIFSLRPLTPDDYAAAAAIRSVYRPEPLTVLELRDQIARSGRGGVPAEWFVAVDPDGCVIGFGSAGADAWLPAEAWSLTAFVRLDHVDQGVGSRLVEHGELLARQAGVHDLYASCRGDDDRSFAWAQRRGYAMKNQRTEGVLDLAGWDGTQFAADLQRVQAGGIRLELVAGVPAEAVLQRLYDLEAETILDIPDLRGMPYPPYAEWRREWFDERDKLTAIAFVGDETVGVSLLALPPVEGTSAITYTTGVARAYRGRGISLALKVLTIVAAQERGVRKLLTFNDPDNPPMLAVNRKLGYEIVPGLRRLYKLVPGGTAVAAAPKGVGIAVDGPPAQPDA